MGMAVRLRWYLGQIFEDDQYSYWLVGKMCTRLKSTLTFMMRIAEDLVPWGIITDIDTGMRLLSQADYESNILGVNGQIGDPGELKGRDFRWFRLGIIQTNSEIGIWKTRPKAPWKEYRVISSWCQG